jgi:hypothetical protein
MTGDEDLHYRENDDAPAGVEIEDDAAGGDEILTEPFDPTKIRLETRTMTVDLLVQRIKEGEINLAPKFQRASGLWKLGAQSRLIESLLIRIPIPAFYMDASNDDQWLVVDGLQRLTVFKDFIADERFGLTELEFLTVYEGKKFSELPRSMQRRILETQVVVYAIQPGTPREVKFNIFKRINTGGLPLSPQEIRHALNQGKPADLLEDFAKIPEFIRVAGRYIGGQRMTDRECVLRFLAFTLDPYQKYTAPNLDSFLNKQMAKLDTLSDEQVADMKRRFERAMNAAYELFDNDAFRKRYADNASRQPLNKALFEAWAVNLDARSDSELVTLIARKNALRSGFIKRMNIDKEFERAISQGTGDVAKVKRRFDTIAELIEETIA